MKAIINIALKQGVLDSAGKATHHTLDRLGFEDIVADVRVGKQIILQLDEEDKEKAMKDVLAVKKKSDIPELNKYQCGTYKMHSLKNAKK